MSICNNISSSVKSYVYSECGNTTTSTSTSTSTTTSTTTTLPPVITIVTEINIFMDDSGSMNSTVVKLEEMRDTLLKDCIGPIYGYVPGVLGSDALYNERVKVLDFTDVPNGGERFLNVLAVDKNFLRPTDNSVNQVLNLTFSDESGNYGYGDSMSQIFDNTEVRGNSIPPKFITDSAALRSKISTSPYIKGVAFQVNTGPNSYPGYRDLTQATFINTGVYVPPINISDLIENFYFEINVIAGTTPIYYLNKIVSGLNTLGFIVSCTPTTTTSSSTSSTTTTTTTIFCTTCIDNNVQIGTQTWTGCNLNVTTYSDGITPIPEKSNSSDWETYPYGAWCWMSGLDWCKEAHGKLYNWAAVMGIYDEASLLDPNLRKSIAPAGYHVPTDAEWTTLTNYVNSIVPTGNIGGKMKATGTIQSYNGWWDAPNTGATNESGFTAIAGGWRGNNGIFNNPTSAAAFWSSSEDTADVNKAKLRSMFNTSTGCFTEFFDKGFGCSVRLIQD
jgi:uncharacterized protein (TIGR02145 family)